MNKFILSRFVIFALVFPVFSVVAAESRLQFLNSYILSTETVFQDVRFGGLSGIVRDPQKELYYAISDARNTPAEGMSRFYTLKINTDNKGINQVHILGMTELTDLQGKSFKTQEVDGESIALTPDGKSLLWASELGSSLRRSGLDGKLIKDFTDKIPTYYNAGGDLKKSAVGLRNGLSFEGSSVTPSGKYLYVAAESALKQDGAISSTVSSSPARILKFTLLPDGNVGELVGEFVYNVDPIARVTQHGVSDNGLSEVLAVSDDKLLVIERAGRNASEGFNDFDFSIKTYLADLKEASNIAGQSSIAGIEQKNLLNPAVKKLLIDFEDYTEASDCIEAVTFGPLIDGKKSLIFVSDNNFQLYQSNKFFMFVDSDGVLNE